MEITQIVAVAENGVIGNNNDLIWRLSSDLKRFKALTMGHPMIMGRKTYESIGKPLPGRTTIIITRSNDYKAEGCIVVQSIEAAIEEAKKLDTEAFIVGGAQIYTQSLPYTTKVELTEVHETFEGDTFLPKFGSDVWKEVGREKHSADEKNKHDYSFVTLVRK